MGSRIHPNAKTRRLEHAWLRSCPFSAPGENTPRDTRASRAARGGRMPALQTVHSLGRSCELLGDIKALSREPHKPNWSVCYYSGTHKRLHSPRPSSAQHAPEPFAKCTHFYLHTLPQVLTWRHRGWLSCISARISLHKPLLHPFAQIHTLSQILELFVTREKPKCLTLTTGTHKHFSLTYV